MGTPIKDMEAAFWDYLNNQPEYLALGLTEYRGYDGRIVPWEPGDMLYSSADLPCIAVELESFGKVGTGAIGYNLQASARGVLVYRAAGEGARTRDAIEAATDTIRIILDSREAHESGLDSSGVIADYVIDFGDVKAWSPRQARGQIVFWEMQFTLTLQGARTYIT